LHRNGKAVIFPQLMQPQLFWAYQGGTAGKAYGKPGPGEEAKFIKNHFQTKS
jgi:hypothetical protein